MAGKNFRKTFELKALDKTARPLRLLARRFDRLAKPVDKLNNKYRAGVLAIQPLTQRFDKFGHKAKEFGRSASTAITIPVAAAGAATIATAANFEFAMKKVGVLTKTTGLQFENLRNKALEIGAATQFSATDAAKGMDQLAVAGFKTNQILTAINPTMSLSAASDMELGETADITSNILSSFGKDAKQTEEITDKLSYAFTNSANRLYDLGEAYRMAGGVAKEAGVSFETVTAMLMKLGDVGHRGTSAGMAIQGAVNRVLGFKDDVRSKNQVGKILVKYRIKPESYIDENENVKIMKLIETLNERGVGKAEFQTLFGAEYGKYLVSLRHVTKDLRRTVEFLGDDSNSWNGLTSQIASVYMEGAKGASNSFKASSEALMLSVASSGLLDDFTHATNYISKQIRSLSTLSPELLRAGTITMGGAASVGLGAMALGGVSKIIASSLSGIAGVFTTRQIFASLLRTNIYTGSLLGLAAFTSWWVKENKEQITDIVDDFENWFKKRSDQLDSTLQKSLTKSDKGNNIYGWIYSFIHSARTLDWDQINKDAEIMHSWTWSKDFLKEPSNIFPTGPHSLNLSMRSLPDDHSYKSPLKKREGFIFNPFTERYYLPDLKYEPQRPNFTLPPVIKETPDQDRQISFNFIFDEVPENMKTIDIKAPKNLRINREIKRSFRGIYG